MRSAWTLTAGCAALALLVAAGAVSASRQRHRELSPLPIVENGSPRGLAAARAWLAATGRPHRVIGQDDAPPAAGEILLVIAPPAQLDEGDAAALVAHAERGGVVLWAMGYAPQPALSRRLGVERATHPSDGIAGDAAPLAPHPLFDGLLLRTGGAALRSTSPAPRWVAGARAQPAAAVVPLGAGEAIVLAGPDVLENFRLGDGDNLSLLARLASMGPIAFDERHLHRAAAPAQPMRRAVALLAAQALLAAVVLLLALGRRLGAVRDAAPALPGRTVRDYLSSLAALYRRAGAERELAEETWAGLRRMLERRAGVPVRATVGEAERHLRRTSPAAADALLRAAEATATGSLAAASRAAASLEGILSRQPRKQVL